MDSVTNTWAKGCEKAGVKGARLHDLRHTRITETGNALNNPLQVAKIARHDDHRMVGRYFNPSAQELGEALAKSEREKKKPTKPSPKTGTVADAVEALRGLTAEQKLAALQQAMAGD